MSTKASSSKSSPSGPKRERIERSNSSSQSQESDFLVALGRQIKNDALRDAAGTKQRLEKLVQFLLNVHWPFSFELSVSKMNEMYPCPSIYSFATDEARFLNTQCINYIICHGDTMQTFKQELQVFDDSKVCGRVWKHNFLAYRCKTCALSPCMSLCNECFHQGDHKGHDYNMFRSQAGGACDCGDENVLLPSGFCVNHGHQKPEKGAPDRLLSTAKVIIPHLLLRLVSSLRQYEITVSPRNSVDDKSLDFNSIVAWLEELTLLGQAMRKTITQLMLCQETYLEMTKYLETVANPERLSDQLFAQEELLNYQKSRGYDVVMKSGPPLRVFPNKNFIEEIFFWGVVYGLPEPLTTFFLNLLPDQQYKNEFARVFLRHYPSLTHTLLSSPSRIDAIGNNIVHISVQLFSNESLALEMVLSDEDLLHVLLTCLTYMVQQLSVQSSLFEGEYHSTVDVSMEVVSRHCYWSIFSDFLNLLAHSSVVAVFLRCTPLMRKYSQILESFTGMDVQKRALFEHIEYESGNYLTAFSVEIEACASPIWSLVYHHSLINKKNSLELLRILHTDLLDTITALGINIDSKQLYPDDVCFHWPLHRSFIILLTRVLNKLDSPEEGRQLKDQIGLSKETVKQVMFAPLHLLCRVNEIMCNVWVRNGHSVMQQSVTYMQPHFSHSLVDADLLFVQFAASYLSGDYFLDRVLAVQGMKHWFSIAETSAEGRLSSDVEISLAESILRLVALVVNSRLSLGMEEEQFCKDELMASLSVGDKPYSQLMDIVTEKMSHNLSNEFKEMTETMMEMLAVFSPPGLGSDGVMRQGIYQLTLQSWLLSFDPLHTSLRSIRKSDFQNSMHRYSKMMADNGYCSAADNLWPPFKPLKPISFHYEKILSILESKTLLGIIFTVLFKAINSENSLPESLLALAVHLLSLSLDHCSRNSPASASSAETVAGVQDRPLSFHDADFASWFPHRSVVDNCSAYIGSVKTKYQLTGMTATFEMINVEEDIVSLLIKLHNKLHREGKGYSLEDLRESSVYHHNYNCGSAVHHLKLVLARMMELSSAARRRVREVIEALSPAASNVADSPIQRQLFEASPSGAKAEFLERKRRAREKNRELMKAMQQRQAKFLEANYEDVMASANEQNSSNSEDGGASSRKCVICNQNTSPSLDEAMNNKDTPTTKSSDSTDYFVIMSMAQISNVLSKRRTGSSRTDTEQEASSKQTAGGASPREDMDIEHKTINEDGDEEEEISLAPNTVADLYKQRLADYLKLFPGQLVSTGLLDACVSPAGVLSVSMCDHVAHNTCISKYKATLHIHDDDDVSSNRFSSRIFSCPVCRKRCNFTVPILTSRHDQNIHHARGTHFDKVLKEYCEQYVTAEVNKVLPEAPLDGCARRAMFSDDPLYPLALMLYYPLLFELVSTDNILKDRSNSTNTETFSSFYNLALNIRRYYLSLGEGQNSLSDWDRLFPDSFLRLAANFIKTDFFSDTAKIIDDLVAKMLNEELVKQLVNWACQLSDDERNAWIHNSAKSAKPSNPTNVKTVLNSIGAVLEAFSQTFSVGSIPGNDQLAFLGGSNSLSHCALSAVIWSEQSLESFLQDQTEHFILLSVLFKSRLLNIPVMSPNRTAMSPQSSTSSHLAYFNLNKSNLLDLPFKDAHSVIRDMFHGLKHNHSKHVQPSSLLEKCKELIRWPSLKPFLPPKLINLPDDYDSLYRMYRNRKCRNCSLTPVNLSVCLICSELICVQERCCKKRVRISTARNFTEESVHSNEASSHALSCGNGVGLVLMLTTSQVLILFNHLAAIWGCLHLDSHGEEDKELRRGKPLFLSRERYEMLNRQWTLMKFDGAHIKWFAHGNKL
ncbi:E3 ubiquitin-protein ligase UBR3-like isoform X2 [Symsagittifera roscoffensis]|uniref:E3 ubiquitin-protein ligase UBR3-like isoform X2 n=1 Tax=Symsagittifera roscoffensis TaxID=84072 RepID=UPI00307C8012